jgi:Tfp pilus assembly protein PilF
MTSRLSMWPVISFAAALVVSATPSGAVAAPDDAAEAAKQHFNRGVASYRDGDFDAALAEFEKAYETRPDYRVLYNLGQV